MGYKKAIIIFWLDDILLRVINKSVMDKNVAVKIRDPVIFHL